MSLFANKTTALKVDHDSHRLGAALRSLKKDAANETARQSHNLRNTMGSMLHSAHLDGRGAQVAASTRRAGRMVSQSTRTHPVVTLALAVGVIALAGYLLTRRSQKADYESESDSVDAV
ncbi:MAG TPA: DUF883 family protein [Pseudomonas xinjiangensis]|uniref:DUF883 family protein n=2 Tax=root TaxID=1 RepID=A0A7V1FRH4_9GAMM|nr:DUF883 family protein [Halopseudomonas xinjiangensis]HEC46090.1 DUF883 family protein [Halopseudomonas xinjiangensis]